MLRPFDSLPRRGRGPLWRDPAARALVFQVLLLIGLASVIGLLVHNTLQNLDARGINTGFDFLDNRAGFSISQTLISYDGNSTYGRTFVIGLLNTLLVSALGIVAATIIGFTVGIARLSPNYLLAKLATVYVELFRNIPLLLQILFWYIAVIRSMPSPRQSLSLGDMVFLNGRGLFVPAPEPQTGFWFSVAALLAGSVAAMLMARYNRQRQSRTGRRLPMGWIIPALVLGLPVMVFLVSGSPLQWDVPALKGFNFSGGLTVLPELLALWIALSIYTAAFIAEIVRSGIQSVPKGQTEAARALSLPPRLTMNQVIIPQAMRVIIPQMTSQYLNLIKNSSLATAIGYPDLVAVFAGTTLNQVGQSVEIMAMTMAVYLVLSLLVSLLMNIYNARTALRER
ncbi:amino acid ABC transporter permease [Larsenimonas rhizosphaerae]|uniref:Amino acid ABC transporter permease n=1 Tax=Larsenimonas rhizosphaerae TaxID=2944682 RepID=A0AA41ZF91_9GAMM|nr:amino acid ABC transporter permease [Larsenimonas rhizosphaerae]MCX2524154.1 amino acid ABC transporter permease [Larsenimonas rhizosphaerae]